MPRGYKGTKKPKIEYCQLDGKEYPSDQLTEISIARTKPTTIRVCPNCLKAKLRNQ